MNEQYLIEKYDEAVEALTLELKSALQGIPEEDKCSATEIRVRAGRGVTIESGGGRLFLYNGEEKVIPTAQTLWDIFVKVCDYSVHTHLKDIKQGYITVAGGHRVGFCGTAVRGSDGKLISLKEISSINIRIAKQIEFDISQVSDIILNQWGGILIVGPPACGKTTLIREIVRLLSNSHKGGKKVAVIDERREITAMSKSIPKFDVGDNSDVYIGYEKKDAIVFAVRTMSPDVIIFDEVSSKDEVLGVIEALNSGVKIITSMHAENYADFKSKRLGKLLLSTGGFSKIFCLNTEKKYTIDDIVEVKNDN